MGESIVSMKWNIYFKTQRFYKLRLLLHCCWHFWLLRCLSWIWDHGTFVTWWCLHPWRKRWAYGSPSAGEGCIPRPRTGLGSSKRWRFWTGHRTHDLINTSLRFMWHGANLHTFNTCVRARIRICLDTENNLNGHKWRGWKTIHQFTQFLKGRPAHFHFKRHNAF